LELSLGPEQRDVGRAISGNDGGRIPRPTNIDDNIGGVRHDMVTGNN